MDLSEVRKINSIIENDRTDATYKYALLRGVIEICQKHQALGEVHENNVVYPLGILIEKWILYYYPLIESSVFIPQKKGEPDGKHTVIFRPLFEKLVDYYRYKGGYSAFYRDYTEGSIPEDIENVFFALVKEIRKTIVNMPMKYLGRSFSKEYYSVFTPERPLQAVKIRQMKDRGLFVRSGGFFSMSSDLAEIFEYFGTFITGEEGILKKWAEFSRDQDKSGKLSESMVLEALNVIPETERSVADARKIYDSMIINGENPECVWSGRKIKSCEYLAVDHAIPFSVWKNNDLWNLLPSLNTVNSNKSDRIPSPSLIEKRSDAISGYWDILNEKFPLRFEKEIRVSLCKKSGSGWQDDAITVLAQTCEYLTDVRGFEAWSQ